MIQAAGGAVWRRSADGDIEVLLVHRHRYDDWTLPKGKLDEGETAADAALREVAEETGMRCELGQQLVTTRYDDHKGRPKEVRYWAMRVRSGAFAPNNEVDSVTWCTISSATERLSYAHDVTVLDALVDHLGRPG